MSRRPRIAAAGHPMHVILRGINRAAVFFDDDDRRFFLKCLAAAAEEASVAVHAYVLMTNHVHLLMTAAEDDGVSAVMKRVAQRYVQYANRTYDRTGSLFEGRFRSTLMEATPYLLACQRYIEQNPVRASVVAAPGDYPWSSYAANALGRADPLITPHALYRKLARSKAERYDAYRQLVEEALSTEMLQSLRESTNGGFVLGSAPFQRKIANIVGQRTWKESPGRPRKQSDPRGKTGRKKTGAGRAPSRPWLTTVFR